MLQDKPWLFFVVYHHAYVPQGRGVQSDEADIVHGGSSFFSCLVSHLSSITSSGLLDCKRYTFAFKVGNMVTLSPHL